MIFVSDISPTQLPPCVATIGCFDGVHRGHRYLIDQVCAEAKAQGLKSALVTFPTHPRQVMQPGQDFQWLSCLEEKQALIAQTEADYCILLPFTRELSTLSAREFMQLLRQRYQVRTLIIGYDHRFGHDRHEGFADYCLYGHELGIRVMQAKELEENGTAISSSLIRSLLTEGNIEQANHYLGYDYYIDGTVESGFQVGRTLGFPTANLLPSCPHKLIPRHGVYATYAHAGGQRYAAMLNIGQRPTLGNGTNITIEAHLIGFDGNLYGHRLRIEFKNFLREEQKFDSLESLVKQLERDKQNVLKSLTRQVEK